jgi:hypothetical protein
VNFIAVDLKVIEVRAPGVARALGMDLTAVLGALVLLWHRCWSSKSDRINRRELRGYFQHPEAGELLEAFGLLEPEGDGWRVKGADRYLRITEQRQKAGHGRAASAGRSAGRFTSGGPAADQRTTSGGPALSPSTEHRAPIEEERHVVVVPTPTLVLVGQEPTAAQFVAELEATITPAERLIEALTEAEHDVFQHWRTVMKRDSRTLASTERKRLLAKWLKVYSVEDLQNAVDGCAKTSWNMGGNPENKRYDDLGLILRDSKHIEDFMRTARGDS